MKYVLYTPLVCKYELIIFLPTLTVTNGHPLPPTSWTSCLSLVSIPMVTLMITQEKCGRCLNWLGLALTEPYFVMFCGLYWLFEQMVLGTFGRNVFDICHSIFHHLEVLRWIYQNETRLLWQSGIPIFGSFKVALGDESTDRTSKWRKTAKMDAKYLRKVPYSTSFYR